MELHKNLIIDKTKYNLSLQDDPMTYFAKSMDFVLTYYKEDFDRIASTKFENVSPEFFLREMTWCILVSGFNARIVSGFFPKIMSILDPLFTEINNGVNIYCANASENEAEWIWMQDKEQHIIDLLKIFNNGRKIRAIVKNAEEVWEGQYSQRWEMYKNNKLNTPQKLEKFEMIGPVISMHLARNIGLLNFVKPDLHLMRMSKAWGFANPIELCKSIQTKYDLPLGLIDLCLFYTASTFGSKK